MNPLTVDRFVDPSRIWRRTPCPLRRFVPPLRGGMFLASFRTFRCDSSDLCEFNQFVSGGLTCTLRAVPSEASRCATSRTDLRRVGCGFDVWNEFLSSAFASSTLGQTRWQFQIAADMRKASTRLPEQGTQTPSPAPDLIPAEPKNQPRTHIAIGTANGGTSNPAERRQLSVERAP
jgi:hypothetical protein